VEAFQERQKEIIRRRREIESLDYKRAARSLWHTQFEFSSGCVIFYMALLFMCINIGMFLLRVGPYKLKYTVRTSPASLPALHSQIPSANSMLPLFFGFKNASLLILSLSSSSSSYSANAAVAAGPVLALFADTQTFLCLGAVADASADTLAGKGVNPDEDEISV